LRTSLVALLLTACGLSAGVQQFDLAGVPVTIEADQVVIDLERSLATLDGRATVRLQDRIFSADHIELGFADPEHPSLVATGHVRFDDPEHGQVTGDGLRYDMALLQGEVTNVEISIPLEFRAQLSDLLRPQEQPPTLRMSAASATRQGNTWLLRGGRLTTSPDNPPQYEFTAGEVEVLTGPEGTFGNLKRIKGKDIKIRVYGSTLLALSGLQLGEGGILFPTVGFNDTYGLFVEHSFSPFSVRPARFIVRPRLGTGMVLSGKARFALGAPVGVFEAVGELKDRKLLLKRGGESLFSRVPEFAWKIEDVETPLGGLFSGRASYGQYDEEGNLTTWRSALQGEYQLPVHQGETSRVSISGGGWYSYYHGPEVAYGWLRGGLNVEKRFGYRLYTGLDLRSHQIFGQSPLFYDQIEVATELNAHARLKLTNHWLLGTKFMVDLNDGVLRREQYSVAYRDRLLEYGLTVLTEPRLEVMFDAKLLGF